DGNGGFAALDGKGHVDGTFTIENVPSGDFYLGYTVNADGVPTRNLIVTSKRAFDLGVVLLGRPDAFPFPKSATLMVSTDGLDAWQSGDYLMLFDLNGGMVAGEQPPMPPTGATSFNFSLDFMSADHPHVVEANKGDRVRILQMRFHSLGAN